MSFLNLAKTAIPIVIPIELIPCMHVVISLTFHKIKKYIINDDKISGIVLHGGSICWLVHVLFWGCYLSPYRCDSIEGKAPYFHTFSVKTGARNNQYGEIHCISMGERYNPMI